MGLVTANRDSQVPLFTDSLKISKQKPVGVLETASMNLAATVKIEPALFSPYSAICVHFLCEILLGLKILR